MPKRNLNYTYEALLKAGRGVLVTTVDGKSMWAIRPGKKQSKARRRPLQQQSNGGPGDGKVA